MSARLIPLTPAQALMRAACEQFGVTREDLLGHCRKKHLVGARQFIVLRLTSELGMSRTAIGRFMNRDHTSIFGLLKRSERKP